MLAQTHCPACLAQEITDYVLKAGGSLTGEVLRSTFEPKIVALSKSTDDHLSVDDARRMVLELAQSFLLEQAIDNLKAKLIGKKAEPEITPVSVSVDHKTGKVLVH